MAKTVTVFSRPALVVLINQKTAIRGEGHRISAGASAYSILLCFTPQSFLAQSAHMIYYVIPPIVLKIGSFDLLSFTPQSF